MLCDTLYLRYLSLTGQHYLKTSTIRTRGVVGEPFSIAHLPLSVPVVGYRNFPHFYPLLCQHSHTYFWTPVSQNPRGEHVHQSLESHFRYTVESNFVGKLYARLRNIPHFDSFRPH